MKGVQNDYNPSYAGSQINVNISIDDKIKDLGISKSDKNILSLKLEELRDLGWPDKARGLLLENFSNYISNHITNQADVDCFIQSLGVMVARQLSASENVLNIFGNSEPDKWKSELLKLPFNSEKLGIVHDIKNYLPEDIVDISNSQNNSVENQQLDKRYNQLGNQIPKFGMQEEEFKSNEVEDYLNLHKVGSQEQLIRDLQQNNQIQEIDEDFYEIDVRKILKNISEGCKKISNTDKKVILVCGNTGAGKSTLVNHLTGEKLVVRPLDESGNIEGYRLVTERDTAIKISDSQYTSETSIPNRAKNLDTGDVYWDCPGFNDTHGEVADVVNAFYIQRIFDNAEEVKVIAVIEETSLTGSGRGQDFFNLIKRLYDMFEDKEKLASSVTIAFTKVERIKNCKNVLTGIIKDDKNLQSGHKEFLLSVLNKADIITFKKPQGFNDAPTEQNRVGFLSIIKQSGYVDKPKVNPSISPNSKLYIVKLQNTANKQVKSIVEKLSEKLINSLKNEGVSLSNLQEIYQRLELLGKKYNNAEFTRDIEIIEFIEKNIVDYVCSLSVNIDQDVLHNQLKELKELSVEVFEGFLGRCLPGANIIEADKLFCAFSIPTVLAIEVEIINKETAIKLEEGRMKLKEQEDRAREIEKNNEIKVTELKGTIEKKDGEIKIIEKSKEKKINELQGNLDAEKSKTDKIKKEADELNRNFQAIIDEGEKRKKEVHTNAKTAKTASDELGRIYEENNKANQDHANVTAVKDKKEGKKTITLENMKQDSGWNKEMVKKNTFGSAVLVGAAGSTAGYYGAFSIAYTTAQGTTYGATAGPIGAVVGAVGGAIIGSVAYLLFGKKK